MERPTERLIGTRPPPSPSRSVESRLPSFRLLPSLCRSFTVHCRTLTCMSHAPSFLYHSEQQIKTRHEQVKSQLIASFGPYMYDSCQDILLLHACTSSVRLLVSVNNGSESSLRSFSLIFCAPRSDGREREECPGRAATDGGGCGGKWKISFKSSFG